jgi:ADP-ribose pyrophosphatase YjhB (NUDIX family)
MERKIIELFLYEDNLKFNEIEKKLKTRSNKIAYHLKNLVKKGILEKKADYYHLSKTSEYLIPYTSEKNAILPIILIHIGRRGECLLIKRSKKPFKEKLGLPGGRIMNGETISQSVSRIMKDKFSIEAKLEEIHSISLENVREKDKIVHSFFLILVSARTKDKIKMTKIDENKRKIISSDYKLIKEDLERTIDIKIINTKNQ